MKTPTGFKAPAPLRSSLLKSFVLLLSLVVALLPSSRLAAQSAPYAVPVGSGSLASRVPDAVAQTDSYYGLPADQITGLRGIYDHLHVDQSLKTRPMPTNHWWTDLLIADRSGLPEGAKEYDLRQAAFGGKQWVYPSRVDPRSYGLDLYYPTQWQGANAQFSNATIDCGPDDGSQALKIRGDRGYTVPPEDVLVADFETGYPQGWTVTPVPGHRNPLGTAPAQGSWTGQGPAPNGFLSSGFVNTFLAASNQGDNDFQGILSGDIVVQKNYVHLLVGGGNDVDHTVVRLRVGGRIVAQSTGDQGSTLRWKTWDVSAYRGQNATVEIVDTSSAGWGFIMCDEIVQSDAAQPVLYPGTDHAIARYGTDFAADDSAVTGWGDWNASFRLNTSVSHQQLDVTMARGVPFTWTAWQNGLLPRVMVPTGTTLLDLSGAPIDTSGGSFVAGAFAFTYAGRTFGVFLPDDTTVVVGDGYLKPLLSGANNYLVVGYLPDAAHLAEFNAVAFACPTDTKLGWSYTAGTGYVTTRWDLTTVPLKGGNHDTIQGWLPHHYRTTSGNLAFSPYTYRTPRGTMRCTTGTSFTIRFPFNGLVPILPAPAVTGDTDAYRPAVMQAYLQAFDPGTMMGDTYWSGKALALCSQYMAWARQTGNEADYDRLKAALETALADWMTYTPGEENHAQFGFFTTYPDWHACIGFGASYGSQAFNDLHFHYGYFATAAATLAMYDPAFVARYKDMLTLIAKSYANYDRDDASEPFLRTFDVWEGHSNAGGLGNGNGENQESSSEAMQGWAGLFLLGGVSNDQPMTAAGAMGFAMEAAATNEYWEDLWQENFPGVYHRAFAGQVYGDSYNYGTFFSGDPAWVYAIQYGPSNHWLNYLTRYNPEVVAAKYNAMWQERAQWADAQTPWAPNTAYAKWHWVTYQHVIYSPKADTAGGTTPPPQDLAHWNVEADCTRGEPNVLGDAPGHVVHAYQALFDADTAAAEFDRYLAAGDNMTALNSQAGSTYYLIHSIRQAGQQDYSASTSAPLSSVYYNARTGKYNYLVFNPADTQQNVTVYRNGAAVGTFPVPAQTLLDSHLDQTLTSLKLTASNTALTIQPGRTVQFTLTGYDQYGATYPLGTVQWSVSGGGTINSSGLFTATAATDVVAVTATSGGLSPEHPYKFRVGAAPVLSSIAVTPGFARVINGRTLALSASGSDQYGDPYALDTVNWTTGGSAGSVSSAGVFTAATVGTDYVTATSGGVSGSGLVAVHAELTNVAEGKQVYVKTNPNPGNSKEKVVDGSTDTRWESTAENDQYLYVDLEKTYDLARVKIEWETAYASNYEVQVSADAVTWTAALPQPVVLARGLGNHHVDDLALDGATGRYLRLKLNTRATDYGFSVWELQVYGYVNAASIAPTSLKVTPGAASTTAGLKTRFYACAFDANADGGTLDASWNVDGGGTVEATGLFTATTAGGPFVVTAKAGSLSGTAAVTVSNPPASSMANVALYQAVAASSSENDGLAPGRAVDGNANTRWASAPADGESITVDLGASLPLAQVVLNWEAAYGKKYLLQGSADNQNWTTLATQGNGTGGVETLPVSGSYRYVKMQGVQRGTPYGYSLYEFQVLSYNAPVRTNKARPNSAVATSAESADTSANRAVDGDTNTRWSSAFNDGESLTVNLGSSQTVSQVVLRWENAYGKQYKLQGSSDGTSWTTLTIQNNGSGGVETFNVSGTYQYIRMQGVRRATDYGYSLWEFQVY